MKIDTAAFAGWASSLACRPGAGRWTWPGCPPGARDSAGPRKAPPHPLGRSRRGRRGARGFPARLRAGSAGAPPRPSGGCRPRLRASRGPGHGGRTRRASGSRRSRSRAAPGRGGRRSACQSLGQAKLGHDAFEVVAIGPEAMEQDDGCPRGRSGLDFHHVRPHVGRSLAILGQGAECSRSGRRELPLYTPRRGRVDPDPGRVVATGRRAPRRPRPRPRHRVRQPLPPLREGLPYPDRGGPGKSRPRSTPSSLRDLHAARPAHGRPQRARRSCTAPTTT